MSRVYMKKAFLFFLLFFSQLISVDRGSSAPLISGDTFRSFCDHIFDETTPSFNAANVKAGDIVFVKTDKLLRYFKRFHRNIKHPYILLTHNSDLPIPGAYAKYLDDSKLIAWFGQNVENFSHPKLIPIPIGLANRMWDHGNPDIFLEKIQNLNTFAREFLVYINFSISTYPTERTHVYNLFANTPYCTVSGMKALPLYLDDVLRAKFVLSPRGNGLDCHRTWEALLMGAIPIVRTSSSDSLYDDLPVVIVNSWEEVNQSVLEKKYSEMLLKKYNLNKKYIYYWLELIRSFQEKI